MDLQSLPPSEYKAIQQQIRRFYLYWHKTWDRERNLAFETFIFAVSLARAMDIPWSAIGRSVGLSREAVRGRYWERIYPSREDIMAYARTADRSDHGVGIRLRELHDLYMDVLIYDTQLFDKVISMRDEGASWTTIGKALGISRQAAQQRFAHPERGAFRRVTALVAP